MKMLHLFRPLAAIAASLLILAGCGGGGGGGGSSTPTSRFGPSSLYANVCTVEGQKQFVRAYLDEVYLWYAQIVDVDPARYATPEEYFYALLVPQDEYSRAFYVGPTPRQQSVALPLASGGTSSRMRDLLRSHTNAISASRTFTTAGGRVTGYIQFDNFDTGAQDDLITAFQQMQAAGVQDLILDLRENRGGYLYIAQTAASMITGPQAEGRIFEQLRYSDKRAALSAASTLYFTSKVQYGETTYPVGTSLPALNLPRVFVLTSENTCSASESVINSLRGIDVQVILIGDNTCGKPYGFQKFTTCGGQYEYYAIEFQGANAKGFGEYQGSGFAPTCRITDGGTRGTGTDPLLAGAVQYIDTGACPAGTAVSLQAAGEPLRGQPRERTWGARILLPQQQPAR